MNAWFKPTAENFFGRIGKPDILQAIKEATGKPVHPPREAQENRNSLSLPNARSRTPLGCRSCCVHLVDNHERNPSRKAA